MRNRTMSRTQDRRGGLRLFATMLASIALVLATASTALGAAAWRIASTANTTVAPGGSVTYLMTIENIGDLPAFGLTSLDVTLPAHLTGASLLDFSGAWSCPGIAGASSFTCTRSSGFVFPGTAGLPTLAITADADGAAAGVLTASFQLSGGGAPEPGTTVDPTRVEGGDPGFGIDAFDGSVDADASGSPYTQAGGHPYAIKTAFDFNTHSNPAIDPPRDLVWPVEAPKDTIVDLPPGLVGNPTVAGQCTLGQLAPAGVIGTLCPIDSQVGVVRPTFNDGYLGAPVPVYNMVPPPNAPARFGFQIAKTVVVLDASLRSGGDYGLTIAAHNLSEGVAIVGTRITFWGVPADPSHDSERACPAANPPGSGGPTCTSQADPRPLLRNPTSCTAAGVGLPTTIYADSWLHPGAFDANGRPDLSDPAWKSATFLSHNPPGYPFFPGPDWGAQQGPTGCEDVPFAPSFSARPATPARADSPAGFGFDLTLPQTDDANIVGTGDLRKAVVTLPEGVRVLAVLGGGPRRLLAGAGRPRLDGRPELPGRVEGRHAADRHAAAGRPARGRDLPGDAVRQQVRLAAGALPRRERSRRDRQAAGPHRRRCEHRAAESDVRRQPASAVLETAPRVQWRVAGTARAAAHLRHVHHARRDDVLERQDGHERLVVHAVAGRRRQRLRAAGLLARLRGRRLRRGRGRSSPFTMVLRRDDTDQELRSVNVDMPKGLLGRIADAVLCADAAANAGTCGDGSRIGSVTVGAGAGSDPFYISDGTVHVTGPYKGAPFGLSIVVHAKAGPFDLGRVVVRAALFVDKHDATLSVVSDPLPTILQGIPLQVRDVRVSVDRDGFMVSPTNCAEQQVGGHVTSTAGAAVDVASRFQVGGCKALALRPRMALRIGGKRHVHRNATTPFSTTLRMSPGQSNLRSVKVTLPKTVNARLDVINRACTRDEFEAGHCEQARAGSAVAITPLLRDPLRGGVYFVRNGHALPDVFVALRGQVDFDLIGRVSIPHSTYLSTTFDAVPDVPITMFRLKFVAGRKGPVGAATNLCSKQGHRAAASLVFEGQNGTTVKQRKRLHIAGCKAARKAAKAKRAAHNRGKRARRAQR